MAWAGTIRERIWVLNDIVAGVRTEMPASDLEEIMPSILDPRILDPPPGPSSLPAPEVPNEELSGTRFPVESTILPAESTSVSSKENEELSGTRFPVESTILPAESTSVSSKGLSITIKPTMGATAEPKTSATGLHCPMHPLSIELLPLQVAQSGSSSSEPPSTVQTRHGSAAGDSSSRVLEPQPRSSRSSSRRRSRVIEPQPSSSGQRHSPDLSLPPPLRSASRSSRRRYQHSPSPQRRDSTSCTRRRPRSPSHHLSPEDPWRSVPLHILRSVFQPVLERCMGRNTFLERCMGRNTFRSITAVFFTSPSVSAVPAVSTFFPSSTAAGLFTCQSVSTI